MTRGNNSRWEIISAGIATAAASGAIGVLVGYLAGQPNFGSILTFIFAAVSATGLGLFSGFKPNGLATTKIIPSINLVVFVICMIIAMRASEIESEQVQKVRINDAFSALENCSIREGQLNAMRKALELMPISGLCELRTDVITDSTP